MNGIDYRRHLVTLFMKRVYLTWLLPIGQLALALACHVYEPHEYRVRAQRDGAVNNVEFTFQHSPAPVGMISRGINFPALVLAYPLRNESQAIYERNSGYALIWIGVNDLGFFFGILVFWYGVARMLDRHTGRTPRNVWTRNVRIAGLSCGTIFGVLTGTYSIQMINAHWRPERQIGAFGVAWAVSLIAYFVYRLARELNRESKEGSSSQPIS
jgi:hypothetical protein